MDTKPCSICKTVKPLDAFSRAKKYRSGRASACRQCTNRQQAQYREAHREQARQRAAEWRKQNPERQKAALRQWVMTNAEYVRQRKHIETQNRRASRYGVPGRITMEQWQRLKARYNNQCLACGKAEPEVKLTIDHIRPLSKGGAHSTDNIQPLCASCNARKHRLETDYRRNEVQATLF